MPIKERVVESEITKYVGMIENVIRSIRRTSNATSMVRRDIQSPTATRLKRIKSMIKRERRPPVGDQA